MANPLLPAGAVPLAPSLIDTDTVMVEVGGVLRRVRRDALLAFLDVAPDTDGGELTTGFPDGTQAAPGMAFDAEPDLGFRRPAANTMEAVADNRSLWRASPAAMTVSVPINGAAVQQSPADATAGRLLGVGAFGLGGSAVTIGNASSVGLPSGFYFYNASAGSSGAPASVAMGLLTHARGAVAGRESQTLIVTDGLGLSAAGTVWQRARTGSAWTPWRSESLHSEGSGPNGRWRRWANGTQECWHTMDLGQRAALGSGTPADPYHTTERDWVFPVQFSAPPDRLSITPCILSAFMERRSVIASYRQVSTGVMNGLVAIATSPAGGTTTVEVQVSATGPWA